MQNMTLTDYLKQTGQTATALAAKVGCEVSTITRLARGERSPSLPLAFRIERATSGLVTIADLALAVASNPSEAA